MNKKVKKLRSKKGMTLVELLVGIAIVVIVFAGTLGAMIGGYSTTVNNADQNRVNATNEATNEVIMSTIKMMKFADKNSANKCIDELKALSITSTPSTPSDERVKAEAIQDAAEKKCTGIQFVESSSFPNKNVDCQYTLITLDNPTQASSQNIDGVIIKTAIKSSSGFVINQSFVPYNSQT